MDSFFIYKYHQSLLEIIILILMLAGLAVIRVSNYNYSFFLTKNLFSKQENFYKSLSSVNLQNKSTFFLYLNFILACSIYLSKSFHIDFFKSLLVLLLFKIGQTIGFFIFENIFLPKSEIISFVKRRLALTELSGVAMLFFMIFTNYLNLDSNLLILLSALVMIIIWIKSAAVLSHNISIFHIILYLCTLEILPILFLVKFIHKFLI